jgi:hypothetical protein
VCEHAYNEKSSFFHLCNSLRARNLLRDNIHSTIEEQVAMFLHVVGHNQRFRVIHQNWRRYIEIVSRYFNEVLYAIGELRDDMIKPSSGETPLKIRNNHKWYPYFKVTEFCHSMLIIKLRGYISCDIICWVSCRIVWGNRWNSYPY